MPISAIRSRQRTVTEEPFTVDETLFGSELASLRRRTIAFSVDSVFSFLLGTPVLLALALGAMYLQIPSLAESLTGVLKGQPMENSNRGLAELLVLTSKRSPGAVPSFLVEPIARGDLEEVERLLEEDPVSLSFDLGQGGHSYWDPINEHLYLHRDVLYGKLASVSGFGALGIAYFTLFSWLGRGRTPGKWLLGIRTVLLSGRPMGWVESFGRAGGYTASFSTLGLGLLQATRDPNRQALHDRIAQTVVLRDRERRLLPGWLRRTSVRDEDSK